MEFSAGRVEQFIALAENAPRMAPVPGRQLDGDAVKLIFADDTSAIQ